MVLLAAALWGSGGIFINLLTAAGFSGPQITAVRLITVPLLVGTLLLCTHRDQLRIRPADLKWFALNGLVGVFGFNLCYTFAIQLTGMATAAVLLYLMPSFVMLFSVAFLRERFTPRKGLCLVLSLAGCALVSGIVSGFRVAPLGLAAGLAAAVGYTAYSLLVSTKLKAYSAFTNVFYPFLAASVCGLVYLAAADDLPGLGRLLLEKPAYGLLNMGLGFFGSVLTYWLFNTALGRIPASQVSILATFEPVAAAMFGVLLFHERLDGWILLGIGCELTALILLELPTKHHGPKGGDDNA